MSITMTRQAATFLRMLAEDDDLRSRFEAVSASGDLAAHAVGFGAQLGLAFTAEELEAELERELELSEIELSAELRLPPTCHSNSGCRTPCVYCAVTDHD